MKLHDFGIAAILLTLLLAGIATMISVKTTGKDDQPLEEVAEEAIKVVTGDDIDLTPNSPENKQP